MRKFRTVSAFVLAGSLALLSGCSTQPKEAETKTTETKTEAEERTTEAKAGAETTTAETQQTSEEMTEAKEKEVLRIGASSTPHAEILEQIRDAMAKKGYELDIITFDDYILPNTALNDGEIDANYFQHEPYLLSFNESNDMDLVSAGAIHYEPFGIYGNDITDLADLEKGATIIIPADDSNETRALFLLAQEGLITLPEDASPAAGVTTLDIEEDNGYRITAVQADTVSAQLKNSDSGSIAVINGNYALAAGLKVADALAIEDASGSAALTYANIVAVRPEDKDSEKTKALIEALQTEDVKKYMEEAYSGAVLPVF
ncbi:MAG: metal ABC transporter substrate-binding protein [Lachnospiraceae bacterium]|nr:metal ABC transporter substrate-binding protein [Lachnospiraceae bacterium]